MLRHSRPVQWDRPSHSRETLAVDNRWVHPLGSEALRIHGCENLQTTRKFWLLEFLTPTAAGCNLTVEFSIAVFIVANHEIAEHMLRQKPGSKRNQIIIKLLVHSARFS